MDGYKFRKGEQHTRITEIKPRHITTVINDNGMSTDRTAIAITVTVTVAGVVIVVVVMAVGMGMGVGMGVFGVMVIPLPVPVSIPVVFAGWCHFGRSAASPLALDERRPFTE